MKRQITVFIADPLPCIRNGVCQALGRQRGIRVVGEADNGLDAVKQCKRLKPDVFIADIAMSEWNGLEAAREVQEYEGGHTRSLLFASINEPYHIHRLESIVRHGIAGFVAKTAPLEELSKGVMAVAGGKHYFSETIAAQIALYKRIPGWGQKEAHENLTRRERQVMQQIAELNISKTIGEKLGMSERTVEVHKQNIQDKLGIKGNVAIALYAHRAGMSHGG